MDVTRSRLDAALRELRKALPDAQFVAMDLEFTGLGEDPHSILDDPARRYEMARADAERFPPCQLGLVLFREAPPLPETADPDERLAAWEALPFNFNLCPRPVFLSSFARYPILDRFYSIQASSAEFLADNGFSFDKMFADGIGWLRPDEEESVRAKKLRSAAPRPDRPLARPQLRPRDEEYLRSIGDQIRKWILEQNCPLASKPTPSAERPDTQNVGTSERDEEREETANNKRMETDRQGMQEQEDIGNVLVLGQPQHPLVRRALHEMIAEEHPTVAVRTSWAQGGYVEILLTRMNSAEEAQAASAEARARQLRANIERSMYEDVGFRHVFDAVLGARVPIVVHNGLLDVCKAYASFVGRLPEPLEEFKAALHELIPVIVDTKVMLEAAARKHPWLAEVLASSSYGGRTALEGLADNIDQVCERLALARSRVRIFTPGYAQVGTFDKDDPGGDNDFHKSDETYREQTEAEAAAALSAEMRGYTGLLADRLGHEAGYDALITGRVFLQLAGVLSASTVSPAAGCLSGVSGVLHNPGVAPFVNRLYLAACGGYESLDLCSDDLNVLAGRVDAIVVGGFAAAGAGSTAGVANAGPVLSREQMVGLVRVVSRAAGCALGEVVLGGGREGLLLLTLQENEDVEEEGGGGEGEEGEDAVTAVTEPPAASTASGPLSKRLRLVDRAGLAERAEGDAVARARVARFVEAARLRGLTVETYGAALAEEQSRLRRTVPAKGAPEGLAATQLP